MKLYYYLRMIMRAIWTQLPILFLTYVIFPFGLAYFMSTAMQGLLEPTVEDPEIEVHVQDQDGSPLSEALVETINSEAFAPVFTFQEDPEDAEFLIRIPAGFGSGIEENEMVPVEIEGKNAVSRTSGRILQAVFTELTEEMAKATYMGNLFSTASLSQAELAGIQSEIVAIQQADLIVEEEYTSEDMLSSQEYFAVIIISYLILMFLSNSVSAEGMTESIGFTKRWRSAPISKLQSFGMEVTGNALQFFIFLTIYVVAWRVVGGIFTQNPFYLLLIISLHSLIASLLNTFIMQTFSLMWAKVIVNSLLFFILIFGGMMGPLEKMTDMAIFKVLNSETINYFITKPYWTLMAENTQGFTQVILQLVLVVVVLTGMNLLSVAFRKKVSV